MGRKTLESFPNKKPLPNRVNIVLTKNKDYQAEGVVLCHDLAELPAVLENYAGKQVFVAGGGTVYAQLLPQCERAYVTKIYQTYPADTAFPNLDENPDWELEEKGEMQEEKGVRFSFDVYIKKRSRKTPFLMGAVVLRIAVRSTASLGATAPNRCLRRCFFLHTRGDSPVPNRRFPKTKMT